MSRNTPLGTVEEINEMMDGETGMTAVAYFVVDGEPISKARARFTNYGSKVRTYTPERTKAGESQVKSAYLKQVGRIQPNKDLAFRVEVDFYCGTRQRRDVDNMVKLVLDGLNGVAYPDDVQVLEVSGRKCFVPKSDARTEVTVFVLEEGMGRPTRACVHCNGQFRTYPSWEKGRSGNRFCSQDCHLAWRAARRMRKCERCGETWDAGKPDGAAKYCSRDCRSEAGRKSVECAICGTTFDTFRSWVGERNYCSPECSRVHDAEVHKVRRTKHFPGTCAICGTGTTRKEYRRCNPCKLAGKKVPE